MSLHEYGQLTDADLANLYAYPQHPVLRAIMVTSADGAATLDGASAGLSSDADRHVFALNRTLADVILVGSGTARAEHYAPVRVRELWRHLREGRTPTPPIAIITGRLDLDPASPLFTGAPPHARTIIITTAQAAAGAGAALSEVIAPGDIVVAGDTAVDLAAAVDALRGRGYQHILAEGGPSILGELVGAGLLDELCLTIGPLLAGPGAPRIVTGSPAAQAQPMTLTHVLDDSGFLLCRYQARLLSERPG
jgi:riboflavin biosynthesis pyrimidine reductase